ncbi:TRICHOME BIREFRINGENCE-LIKE 21 [Actinidia rufa]|uniref:TRICHOME BIREFRINGENCE-LIKE 21 n=1 Tax=Actinidia rufa TaxID=165716 RepID=A0A7J0E8R5_9ERIC|nr:TRICHOME BIREFRINGENCE-LIKE 21 [Actinidia rufa]
MTKPALFVDASLSPHAMELPFGKNQQTLQKSPKILILIALTIVLFTIVPLYYPLLGYTMKTYSKPPPNSYEPIDDSIQTTTNEKCDIFTGEWVPNPEAPYYTNKTCWAIHEHQNCMKYGRPDDGFMRWRWKPDGCELPLFNPFQFLEIVRGKSLAFVGDSVGRNQMQSLICLLSRVEYPIDASYTTDENFKHPNGPSHTGLFNLYLDEYDETWTSQIDNFDYVILSAGHWFYRSAIYYENRRVVGCRYCQIDNITDLPMYYGYRRAFRTAFRAINGLENFKGIVFLRTFAPSHFEGGLWNKGGNCLRTRPFRSNETNLEGEELELYMTQMEEFRDGHPSRYGHWPHENVTLYNDCVHWCLPGPIDTWGDFLLEMLKREGTRSHEENVKLKEKKFEGMR